MTRTRWKFLFTAAAGFCLCPAVTQAAIITLAPGTINSLDTTTTSYSDANVTLTPQIRDAGGVLVGTTFNGNAARLGIDDVGTSNGNAFNDPNTTSGDQGDEALEMVFASNAGLSGLAWDFSRADGPLGTDGVNISGFLTDPGASFTGDAGVVASYAGGVLNLQLSAAEFKGADTIMTLAVPGASAGQTLLLTVGDSTEAGAQLAVTSLSYDNDTVAVPEPGTFALVLFSGLAGLAFTRRR